MRKIYRAKLTCLGLMLLTLASLNSPTARADGSGRYLVRKNFSVSEIQAEVRKQSAHGWKLKAAVPEKNGTNSYDLVFSRN